MKLTSTIISLVTLFAAASALDMHYDTEYDNPLISLDAVACATGHHGLLKKYKTFGDLPSFPYIAGVEAIGGRNSPACGSCWRITYEGKSIDVLGIDTAGDGLNLSLEAMNKLTDGDAEELGVIDGVAVEIDRHHCGL